MNTWSRPAAEVWELIDHVCKHCFGRLLQRHDEDGVTVRCAECETEVRGAVGGLCACGAKLPNGRLAGLKCKVNPSPTLEQPARVVVFYAGDAT